MGVYVLFDLSCFVTWVYLIGRMKTAPKTHQPFCAPFILFGNEPQPHHPPQDDRLPDIAVVQTSWYLIGVVDGTLSYDEAGHRHILRAGQTIVSPPGVYRSWDDSTAHYRFLAFDLTPQDCVPVDHIRWRHRGKNVQADGCALWGVDISGPPPEQLLAQAEQAIRWCCDRWWRGVPMRVQAQARLATLIADWLYVASLQQVDSDDRFSVAEFEALRRLPTGFSVNDMAGICGMSRVVFSRQYREARGESPGKFLRRARLELATELLQDPAWTIASVAKHVGYRSAVTFSRSFSEYYGCSPQQWLLANRSSF